MIKRWQQALKGQLLNLLRERVCPFCASPLVHNAPADQWRWGAGQSICTPCRNELPWTTVRGDIGEYSAFYYESPISDYILAGKSGKQLDKLRLLGELITLQPAYAERQGVEAVIPVPLHYKRLRARGFNQSIELARPLATQLGIPLLTQPVRRTRHTQDQKNLPAAQRKTNIRGAFILHKPIPYRHIALFDDVITTGATCLTLRDELLRQGVEKVDIWCCATTKQ